MEVPLMKRGLLAALIIVLSACASKKVEETEFSDHADTPDFQRGLKALEKEDFGLAASIFDGLLVAKPGTEVDLITTYNSGNAYEGLGNCQKAADRYREVVRGSAGKFAAIEAQALFRLS